MKKLFAVSFAVLFLPVTEVFADYSPQFSGIITSINGQENPYLIFFSRSLPGATNTIHFRYAQEIFEISTQDTSAFLQRQNDSTWTWRAPDTAGVYPLTFYLDGKDSILINMFVVVPRSRMQGEYLNGYHIGHYPTIPLRNLAIYTPPEGFIEVTEQNIDTRLSPHFTLRQFLCKQESGFPKYVFIRTRLILKLELILRKLNEGGYPCETLSVMSGYRTPFYNHAIGNVKYSRHIFGGAADIFVDQDPVDGMMDDLNSDGRSDYHDAEIVYDIIDDLYGQPFYEAFVGGLGWYRRTASHGPFVHVDVRGFRARWGD